jgi:hypothetical protein
MDALLYRLGLGLEGINEYGWINPRVIQADIPV